jgi:membrane protein
MAGLQQLAELRPVGALSDKEYFGQRRSRSRLSGTVTRAPGNAAGSPAVRFVARNSHSFRAFSALLRAAWREYEADYAGYLAAAMVYYALVSLVPLLLLILSGIGLMLRWSDAAATAEQQALYTIQVNFGSELRATVERLLLALQQQSVVASVVSLLGLLLTASLLLHHLRWSFRALWNCPPILLSGSLPVVIWRWIMDKALAFAMVIAGGALLLLTFMLNAGTNWLKQQFSGWILIVPTSLLIVPLTFALLFRFLPPSRLPWRHVWLASLLCAGAWFGAVRLLALYGSFFGRNFSAYGAIGAVLAIMLWMNAVSQCLFFGAELCKVISRADSQRMTTTAPSA